MMASTVRSTMTGSNETWSERDIFDRNLYERLRTEHRAKFVDRRPLAERVAELTQVCEFCQAEIPPVVMEITIKPAGPDGDAIERSIVIRAECDCEAARQHRADVADRERQAQAEEQRRQEAEALHRRYAYSGLLDMAVMDWTFESFERQRQPAAYDAAHEFAKTADGREALVMCGPFGLGKTHLAIAITHHWIRQRGMGAKFYSASGLWSRIRRTYDEWGGEGEANIYNEVAQAPLLILDDVGRRHTNTEASRNYYDRIIGARYERGAPMVVTTNLSIGELESWITLASFSRLAEMAKRGSILSMVGDDYRLGES